MSTNDYGEHDDPFASVSHYHGDIVRRLFIAAGIAILRYRLYDLDIVINRTLVYGPLTAVLAGVFAATIGLTQKAFVAITGQRSDAAVVITTLVVVSVSTPVRTFIQALVDRKLKQVHDPAKELRAFTANVASVYVSIDEERIARKLLDSAVFAFDAVGGSVHLTRAEGLEPVATVGTVPSGDATSIQLVAAGREVGRLAMGHRRDGKAYSEADIAFLNEAATTVAQMIASAPWKSLNPRL